MPTTLDKFSWLHISDFHFSASGDDFGQDVSASEIIHDIASRLSDQNRFEFVVVTGDIAYSGKPNEYTIAEEFFKELAEVIGLGLDRFFVVPGNHDVDRAQQQYMHRGVLQALDSQQSVDDFLGREGDREALMERQSAFRNFRERVFTNADTVETEDGLARVGVLDLDGLRVSLLELNSSWISGPDDSPGGLVIGERQMINALKLVDRHRPHLAIGLAHHPSEWLAEFDRMSCNGRLLPRLDVLHTGHLHRHDVSVSLMPGSECLLVAAGASHATRHFTNSYNVVEFDCTDGEYRIRRFEYRPNGGIFVEIPGTAYGIPFREPMGATSRDLADAVREVEPSSAAHCDYLAALLTGEMNDVPVKLGGGAFAFGSRDLPEDFQIVEVQEFLKLSNHLRIRHDVDPYQLLTGHCSAVKALSAFLSEAQIASAEFATSLKDRVKHANMLLRNGEVETTIASYQVQYLEELAHDSEWDDLAEAAARYRDSNFSEVRVAAQRNLVVAKLRSSEKSMRVNGLNLAYRIINEEWASCGDYVVASAGAHLLGDDHRAISVAMCALGRWPDEQLLRDHCRTLAVRTGSKDLRYQLETTGVSC